MTTIIPSLQRRLPFHSVDKYILKSIAVLISTSSVFRYSGAMPGPTGDVRNNGDFDFRSFFMDIPPVTRTLFLAMFVCTLLSGLGILPLEMFLLQWPYIVGKLQIWRALFTFLHMGRLGLAFLIRIYFLFVYSKQLEIGVFFGRPANYAWFLTFVSIFTLVFSTLFPSFINGGGLLTAIIHLWGRHATNVTVSLYGFIQIPAKYLSLAMIGLDIIISGGVATSDILGLLGGHLYYFLDSVYPAMPDGKQLIFVPMWFERFIDRAQASLGSITGLQTGPPPPPQQPSRFGGVTSRSTSSQSEQAGERGSSSAWRSSFSTPTSRNRHNWGTGHTLGSS